MKKAYITPTVQIEEFDPDDTIMANSGFIPALTVAENSVQITSYQGTVREFDE